MKAATIAGVILQLNTALHAAFGAKPVYEGKLDDAPEEFRVGLLAKVEEFIADPEAKLPVDESGGELEKTLSVAKGVMFRAAVDALKPLADEAMPAPPPAPLAPDQLSAMAVAPDGRKFLPVKYIGKRPEYRDGVYQTNLVFVKDQTRMVPAEAAALMLRHADVYVLGEAAATVPQVQDTGLKSKPVNKTHEESNDPVQIARDQVAHMGKPELASFAKIHFNVNVDQKKKVGELRTEVTGLIDRLGLA